MLLTQTTQQYHELVVSARTAEAAYELMRAFVSRYRQELLSWALPGTIMAVGSVVALVLFAPWVAIVGTLIGGAVRVGLEIGRRDRIADIEETLRARAGAAVAGAAARLVEQNLWQDEKATEATRKALVERIVAARMGQPALDYIPIVARKSWSLDDVVAQGPDAFDIRRHDAGDWLRVASELRRGRDRFRDSVGPHSPDLTAEARRLLTDCLESLSVAAEAAELAFHVLYPAAEGGSEAIDAASGVLFERLKVAHRNGSMIARPRQNR